MLCIKDMTDNELLEHIAVNNEILETADCGTVDYNSAVSELTVARSEKMRREIRTAEAKDKLVLEYLGLSMKFTEPKTVRSRQLEIKVRLNEIREYLGMEIDAQKELLSDLRMEQLETT